MMFIKVHHLKTIELIRDLFDLLCLPWLDDFYTWGIPGAVSFGLRNGGEGGEKDTI